MDIHFILSQEKVDILMGKSKVTHTLFGTKKVHKGKMRKNYFAGSVSYDKILLAKANESNKVKATALGNRHNFHSFVLRAGFSFV